MGSEKFGTQNSCRKERAKGLVQERPFLIIPATFLVIPAKAGIHC